MSLLSSMTENSWVVMFVQHSLCPDIVLHDVFEDMTSHRYIVGKWKDTLLAFSDGHIASGKSH